MSSLAAVGRRGVELAVGARPGSRSTTGPVLRRLRGLLVALTVLVLVTTSWVFAAVHDLAQAVRTGAAPAILELSTARTALLAAEQVAVGSRTAERPADSYPEFLRQVQVAGQALARAAAVDVAAGDGAQLLQSVQGQLVSYQGIVAAALYGPQSADLLVDSDLVDAYQLMHDDQGMLRSLALLIRAQQDTVTRLASSGRLSPWSVPLWLLPLLLLAAVLAGLQIFLARRLRRMINPWLVLASLVLVVAAAYVGTLGAADRLGTGRDELLGLARSTAAAEVKAREAVVDAVGCRDSGCGRTLPLAAAPDPVGVPADSVTDAGVFTRPPGDGPALVLVPLAAGLIGALGWAGLHGPVSQYRFRP